VVWNFSFNFSCVWGFRLRFLWCGILARLKVLKFQFLLFVEIFFRVVDINYLNHSHKKINCTC
jgi:hypothetical protein